MFFALSIPNTIFKNPPATALAALNFEMRDDLFRAEFADDKLYILIGRIYGTASSSLDKVAELFRRPSATNSLRGRFLFIECSWSDKTINLHIDKYRLLNAMRFSDEKSMWLGNDLSKLPTAALKNRDDLSAQTLKEVGLVVYPYTLFKAVQFLKGDAIWSPDTGYSTTSDHALLWPQESADNESSSATHWISVLKNSFADLIESWRPQIFRMSGGIDTRLISFLIPKDYVAQIQAQVLCHPRLSPEQDRDVLGARLVADHLNFDLQVLRPEKDSYNYVGGLESPYTLSGLYGGEFLGGLMYDFSPLTENKNLDFSGHPQLQKRVTELGLRRFTTELFLSSFRSTIYQSVLRSWASPWELNQRCLSPFVEQQVLDHLLQTPFDQVQNYKLYAKIVLEFIGRAAHWPLTSPITLYQKEFSSFSVGLEPKSLPSPTETTDSRNLGEQNLQNFLTAL